MLRGLGVPHINDDEEEGSLQPLDFQVGVPTVPSFLDETPWAREDGMVEHHEAPRRYNREWRQIVFSRAEVLRADPEYQFLVMVAGAANTSVESLYQDDGIRQVQREAQTMAMDATKASAHLTELWEPYNALVASMQRLMQEGTVEKRNYLNAQTNTALEQAHNYHQIMARKPIRDYVRHSTAVDGRPSGHLGADTPTPRKFNNLMVAKAIDLSWLTQMDTTTTPMALPGLVNFMDSLARNDAGVAKNVNTLITKLAEVSLRDLDTDPTFKRAFILAVLETSWHYAVRLNAVPMLLRFDEDTEEAYTVDPLVVGAPGGRGGGPETPIEVWIDWAKAAFAAKNLRDLMASQEFKGLHSLAFQTPKRPALLIDQNLMRLLQTSFATTRRNVFTALNNVEADLELEQGQVPVESLVGKNMTQAINFVDAMGLAFQTADNILKFVNGDYMLHVETSLAGLQSVFDGLQATQEQQQKKIDKAIHQRLKPMVKPGKDRVRPGWILRPEFTHRVNLSAPTVAAINNAFAKVQQHLPLLVSTTRGGDTELVHRGLKRTKILNQLYANLVASYLLKASIQFPRQWQADKAYARSEADRLRIIMSLSSWVWGAGAPYNTGQLRAAVATPSYVPGMLGSPLLLAPPAGGAVMFATAPLPVTAALTIGRPLKRQRTASSAVMPIASMAHFAMNWSPAVIRSAIVKALTETAHSRSGC